MRRACSILFGQRAGLIVFNNAVGLALVFAVAAAEVGMLAPWERPGWRRLRPRPLDPPTGETGIRTVTVDLTGIAHRFRTGHRLRAQVSSGAHPRFVRNTGTAEPLATATTLRATDIEILHNSHIQLPQPI